MLRTRNGRVNTMWYTGGDSGKISKHKHIAEASNACTFDNLNQKGPMVDEQTSSILLERGSLLGIQ